MKTAAMKPTIKERLNKKTITEIDAIAKRIGFPLRGNKAERIHSLYQYFRSVYNWQQISNPTKP